jgi:hypothetical protein
MDVRVPEPRVGRAANERDRKTRRIANWLKHAFAVDPPGPAVPNDVQRRIIERLCGEVVRRQLTVPALLMLEMSRPLNSFSAQALHFFQPIATAVVSTTDYHQFALFLEQRGSIEYVIQRIEALDADCRAANTIAAARSPRSATGLKVDVNE